MAQAPFTARLSSGAQPAAAAADLNTVVGEAPQAGVVSAVKYVPSAAMTGANTDKRTLTLQNKGQSGTGTTVVATLDFVSGINLVAFDEKDIVLSNTPANLVVAQGDVLEWLSVHSGSTGLADPGGKVEVEISRS